MLQGNVSEYQRVTSGVPKGSVLGPALHLIYINNISEAIDSKITLFAEDALMHLSFSDSNSHLVF